MKIFPIVCIVFVAICLVLMAFVAIVGVTGYQYRFRAVPIKVNSYDTIPVLRGDRDIPIRSPRLYLDMGDDMPFIIFRPSNDTSFNDNFKFVVTGKSRYHDTIKFEGSPRYKDMPGYSHFKDDYIVHRLAKYPDTGDTTIYHHTSGKVDTMIFESKIIRKK